MATKALISTEDGEWELRTAKKNSDNSYSVGDGDYIAEPREHIQTLKIKRFTGGYNRHKFFIAHIENPVPLGFRNKTTHILPINNRIAIEGKDTASALRSFRRAHIVEGLGRASRELPGNNMDKMKIFFMIGIAVVGLILYYTGAVDGIIGWLTSSPSK